MDGLTAWAKSMPGRAPSGHAVAFYAAYVVLYVVLDRVSFIDALYGLNITAWSPSAGITLFLLIVKGPRCAPLVLLAEMLSQALTQGSIPPPALFTASLCPAVGYSATAVLLQRLGFDPMMLRTSDVAMLFFAAVFGAGAVAVGTIGVYTAANLLPWSGFAAAVFRYWVGDAIGIVVFTPALLLMLGRIRHPAPADSGPSWLVTLESAAQAMAIAVVLWAMFSRLRGGHPFEYFYVLFMPVVWIATRHGLARTSWAIVGIQVGLILGFELQGKPSPEALHAYQLMMMSLAITGLLLGVVISEQHRLSGALADSERHRATILNTARDGIVAIDAHGAIQWLNPAVERLFGRAADLLVGRDIRDLIDLRRRDLEQLKQMARSPAGVLTWEGKARRGDEVFPIEVSAGRFDFQPEEQYALVLRDITRRRQAETEARQHQAELARYSRVSLAGEMAAGLAHELSQPLTAIAAYARGAAWLLNSPNPDPVELHRGLAEVVGQADRAAGVLSRVREFVRPGSTCREFVQIQELIDGAISLATIEAAPNGVATTARVEPDLPPVFVDRIQIEQVLLNLMRNAVDAIASAASRDRSILIEARRSGSAIEIAVSDTGPGVSAEVGDRIFDPFVTTKPRGMGMGLTISRSIVRSHGSRLRLVEGAGPGAIFAFELPTEAEAGGHGAG